ncbi:hypothetical protein C7N43_26310 [Sphingobacteriales bacterium UPWRP_1]|nr:hypothetical protein B6N25_13850 [Sphingobacteriales bacterium TSM_CSS]PSJ73994.1 hypothetical protein C7N43_26310 [Sphingobacteriales bacterium UPWRP_1]
MKQAKAILLFIPALLTILSAITLQPIQAQPAAPNFQCASVLLSGNIQLTWAPGTGGTNCGATFTAYNIYVSNSASGPFSLLTSVTDPLQTTFTDATSNPSGTLYYYLETQCGGAVSSPSVILDTQQPVAPVITSASVLNNTTVQLNWLSGVSPETAGYIIYRADENGNFIPIDTIFNAAATFYQDTGAQPDAQPEAYKIAAFDACSNVTPGPDNGIPHQTVHLSLSANDCSNQATISWTPYLGWGTNLAGYSIVQVDNNNVAIANIADVDTATTTYTYTFPDGESSACFRIVAHHSNNIDIANSNFVCANIVLPQSPDYICLVNATVGNNDTIFLQWNIDTANPLNNLSIRRSQTDSLALTQYSQFPFGTPAPSAMTFADANADPAKYSYTYQVQHVNNCNQPTYSGIVQTVRLRGRDQYNLTNGLDWTAFYLTGATVQNYNIYRSPIGQSNFTLLATITPDVLEYEDPVTEVEGSAGFCYRVEAVFQVACPDGFADVLSSWSNIVCINQTPRIFVPNAFAPNGINNVFKPVILYPNADDYTMKIMNRWGEILFTTTNPDEGWDGNFKGNLAPQGVYAYVIQMKTPNGITLERKGTLMLLR